MKHSKETAKKITIIGLGQMGSALTRTLLKNGYEVHVWNRSREKAKPLVEEGAILVKDTGAAIAQSPVTVVCVLDYQASWEIMDKPDVHEALPGKTLIQLTTGSPQDASENETWAIRQGAKYLDGAIQAVPEQMGRPDTTIFISGLEETYQANHHILNTFGGNLKYLGGKISTAAAMDLASLSYMYGAFLGFFHAAQLAEAEGFPVDVLGNLLREISPGLAEFIQYEARVIHSGNFSITQSPLSINIEATERILRLSHNYKINTDVPALAVRFFKRAKSAGYENEELAALIKVFRS